MEVEGEPVLLTAMGGRGGVLTEDELMAGHTGAGETGTGAGPTCVVSSRVGFFFRRCGSSHDSGSKPGLVSSSVAF